MLSLAKQNFQITRTSVKLIKKYNNEGIKNKLDLILRPYAFIKVFFYEQNFFTGQFCSLLSEEENKREIIWESIRFAGLFCLVSRIMYKQAFDTTVLLEI